MFNETKSKFEQEGASYQYERELLRISKEELSDITGYSYDTISKFERGEEIQPRRYRFKEDYLIALKERAYDSYIALERLFKDLMEETAGNPFERRRS